MKHIFHQDLSQGHPYLMSVDSSSSNDSILNFDTSLLPSPFAATQPAPEAVIYRPPAPTAPPAPPPVSA